MDLTRITSLAQLEQYRDDWSLILEENQNTNPFIEFVWVYEWWKHFGDEYDMEIILVKQNDRPVGFVPFIYKRRWFSHLYTFMARGHANYMDFVVYNHLLQEVIEFVFDEMIKENRNAVFYLYGLLESSQTPRAIEDYLQQRKYGFTIHRVVTPYINLNDIKLGKHTDKRKKLYQQNKREKRLRENGEVRFSRSGQEEMETVFQLHDKRWKKKRDTSGFTNDKDKEFYRSLVGIQEGPMQTELDALYINDTMIAFHYGFNCRGRVLSYVLGFDDNFEPFGPGRILEREKILQCKIDAIEAFDFSIGYEPYKFALNTNVDYTRKMIFSSTAMTAKITRSLLSMKESLIDRLKKNYKFVLFIRITIGKILFVFRNLFNKTESNGARREIRALLTRLKKFLYEKERYIVYRIENKEVPVLDNAEDFIELTINDAMSHPAISQKHLKEICEKMYRGYKGYYPAGNLTFENIFWMNDKVLRIGPISYSERLGRKAIHFKNWHEGNLEAACYFVKKNSKAKTVFVTVKDKSEKDAGVLETVGFSIYKQIYKRTFLGNEKYEIIE
ncbi:GNAT family N-acetyltransferase [Sporosarcina sp. ACRSL]|uniref:GNAT family N-acetyltransferase n=1 Tax=Sporosarcina sp. ACRSL TaxID=2918215 RepID=UPI001EF74C1E|nr:GNAT family N-acetyltransferase [Sporosarcina sp. ACRSL]MCG7345452.1 GNAT family N-acetyltransferase [Sporosarcina sp. ACRSL]